VAFPELVGGFAALVPHGLKEGVGEQEDALFEESSGVLLGPGGGGVLLGGRGDDEDHARDGGEGRPASGGDGEDVCAGLVGSYCREDDAGSGSRAGGCDEEVAGGDGGGGDFADDVDGEAEVHEAHGGHLQGEAAAAGSGDEDAGGGEDGVDSRASLSFADMGEGVGELVEDEVLVGGEAGCCVGGFGGSGCCEGPFGMGRRRHNSVSLAGLGGRIKLKISMDR
jgi:hypothetical protein